jgi:predicted AAA+ superfamily ATPase
VSEAASETGNWHMSFVHSEVAWDGLETITNKSDKSLYFVIERSKQVEIRRDSYLKKLIGKEKNGLIKVVTGVRQCGKSYLLLNLFHDYLVQKGIDESYIIEVALEDRKNFELRNPDNMLQYVKQRIVDKQTYYVFLDEVQLLSGFEDVLHSFLLIQNVDVYVSGSHSKLLSTDSITEFRGRGDEIRMYPLSFREYTSVYAGTMKEAWEDYSKYGGLPQILLKQTPEEKAEHLLTLFQEVYLPEIVERHSVRNKDELSELAKLLSSSVGLPTSPSKLAQTFQSVKNETISDKTLNSYIGYLMDAFLLDKAARFDIKKNQNIASPAKFYFEDVGLLNAGMDFRQTKEDCAMENIIFNELRIRGYQVDVGAVEWYTPYSNGKHNKRHLEVDFIASKGNRKYYVQSVSSFSGSDEALEKELPLLSIRDSFPKVIVVNENINPRRNEAGIMTIGITNFLLDENSLNL